MEREKIACVLESRHEEILHIREALTALGRECELIIADSYTKTHAYWQRKAAGLHLPFAENRADYFVRRARQIREGLTRSQPDQILLVNPPGEVADILPVGFPLSRVVCWFVDVIGEPGHLDQGVYRSCRTFVFARSDQERLRTLGIPAGYEPVGYQDAYTLGDGGQRDIDILFVGTPYRSRRDRLAFLAGWAAQEGWNLRVCGPFWEEQYFWKKQSFRLRFPQLAAHVDNRTFSPAEVCALYHRSKICLNLHEDRQTGRNPRTFEILATGAFELVDARQDYDILEVGRDLDAFSSDEEMLEKIRFYLSHPEEREQIAHAGAQTVRPRRSMTEGLRRMLEG